MVIPFIDNFIVDVMVVRQRLTSVEIFARNQIIRCAIR